MNRAKRLTVTVLTAALVLGTAAGSIANGTRATYRQWSGTNKMPSTILFRRCHGAEDELAHLRLMAYGQDRAVYRCQHTGY